MTSVLAGVLIVAMVGAQVWMVSKAYEWSIQARNDLNEAIRLHDEILRHRARVPETNFGNVGCTDA
jgi:hypothetical protein